MATVQDPVSPAIARNERFVQKQLAQAVRRVRWLDMATAGLGLLIMALAYGLGMVLVDRWLNLAQGFRIFSLIVFSLAALAYVWFVLLRPVRKTVNPYYAARQVEQTIPDAKNSLVNWLDLHDENLPATVRSAIGERAAADLKETDVQQAIQAQRVTWLGALAVGLAAAALIALAMIRPDQFFSLVQRAFNPFDSGTIVKQTRIKIVSPENGDAVVPVNQSVLLAVEVNGRIPDKNKRDSIRALVRYSLDQTAYEEYPLEQEGRDNSEWMYRVPPHVVQNGFWYKIIGGDDETPEYRVQVRSTPLLNSFEVDYRYPDYLHWQPRHDTRPNLEGIRGTRVTLVAYANRSVREGRMIFDDKELLPITGQLVAGEATALRFEFVLEKDAKYRIFFSSTDGENNSEPLPYTIRVTRDQEPTLEITKPAELNLPEFGGEIRLPANGLLKLEGVARDDFGITNVSLKMKLEGMELQPKVYRNRDAFRLVDGTFMRQVEYMDFVELDKLKMAAGQPATVASRMTLEFWLEAEDNCEPNANVGRTRVYRVHITPPRDNEEERKNQKAAAEQDKQAHEQKQDGQRGKENEDIRKNETENPDKPKNGDKSDVEKKLNKLKEELAKQAGEQSKSNTGENEPKPDRGEAKPDQADARNEKPSERPEPPKGDPKDKGDMNPEKNPAADAKGSNQQNGNAAGQSKPQDKPAPQPDKSEPKKAGESRPEDGAVGEPKKPMDGGMGEKPGQSKDQGQPPKDGGMGDGGKPDQKTRNEQGTAKGNPDKANPPNPNPNDPPQKQDANAKPGDGMGEPKPDQAKPTEGEAKNGPQQPKDGAGQAGKPADDQQGGNAKPEKKQAVAKSEPKPNPKDGAQGQPDGNMKPGNDPNAQSKAGDGKPMPKDQQPMGNGQMAQGEPKPDKGAGKPDDKAGGAAGKDDVAKLADQMKNVDAKAREQAKQKLQELAQNSPNPKQRQAAEDALKQGQQRDMQGEGVAKNPPRPANTSDPMGQPKESQVADAKPGTPDAKNTGERKAPGGDPKQPNANAKPSEDAKASQQAKSESKSKPADPNFSSAKGDGTGQSKTGEGKPQADSKASADAGSGKSAPKSDGNARAQTDPKSANPMNDPPKGQANDGKGLAKGDPTEPGQPKGQPGSGTKPKASDTAGANPGDGSSMPTRVAGGNSTADDQTKYTDPNQKFKDKAGDLRLDDFKNRVTKEMLQKHNISEEEWQRHLEAEAKRLRESATARPTDQKKDLERGNRTERSFVNTGAKRVEAAPGGKTGDLKTDSLGQAPPEYKEAADKFSKMLSEPRGKKK